MAKFYDIKFSCGHEERRWGVAREKIPYLKEHGLCSACYKAKIEAERAALRATLPDTGIEWKGSEKQIKWGKDIMARLRKECQEEGLRYREFFENTHCDRDKYLAEGYKFFMEELDSNSKFYNARYMIDRWSNNSAENFIYNEYNKFRRRKFAGSFTDAIKDAF